MAISHKHQLLKYPEYVSPLPADFLIKVAERKQTLLDEGVAKVQKRIDELDQYGFSLLKDEDKQYFSQEMDKFIKSVNESSAKADFSNPANVKSVLSIGRPLETDPYILNAIQSSAEVKRRQQALASMKPEERSAANDFDFMSEAYDYLNDKKVGTKIANSGKAYTPYKNLSKKYTEVVDKIKPQTVQVPQFVNGRWIVTTKTEELSAARLNQAFEATLDESDRNQLRIDTKYDMHVRGKENIANEYLNHNLNLSAETSKAIEATKVDIDKTMQLLQKYPDPATRQSLEDKQSILKELEIRQKIYATNATKTLDNISESDLVSFHKNQFISNLSNAYAYKNIEQDIKADPYGELAVKHSYDVAMENLRTLNNIEAEREKDIIARLKGKDVVTAGAGFLSIFNPDPEVENYAEKVSTAAGGQYLFDKNPKNVEKWEDAYKKYNSATNALDKLKALKTLVKDFRYDAVKVTGRSGKTDKEIQDAILDSRKQKAYEIELLDNLVKSYEKIQKYQNDRTAQIRVTYPDNNTDIISVETFLSQSFNNLIAPLSGAKKIELYAGNNKGENVFEVLKDFQELTQGSRTKPAKFKQSGKQLEQYFLDQGLENPLGKYLDVK